MIDSSFLVNIHNDFFKFCGDRTTNIKVIQEIIYMNWVRSPLPESMQHEICKTNFFFSKNRLGRVGSGNITVIMSCA